MIVPNIQTPDRRPNRVPVDWDDATEGQAEKNAQPDHLLRYAQESDATLVG